MTISLEHVLPVLRAASIAHHDTDTFYVEIPGDRVGATPLAAFTMGQGLLTKAQVANSGVSSDELFAKARANLVARAPVWTVESKVGGFLGLFKKNALLSLTDEFAAEQIMNDAFMRRARELLSPDSFDRSRLAFFVPKRGQLRAVLMDPKSAAVAALEDKERQIAVATWNSAGADAVCPAELGPSGTVGNTFAVRKRFDGKDEPYLPLLDSVRAMVMHKKTFTYVTYGSTAKKRKFVGDLSLCLGIRDENGQQTPLPEDILQQLGLPFDSSLDRMLGTIPQLPVVNMGHLGSGQPVFGFRGKGAIDQLASPEAMQRLHAALGPRFHLHVYSHGRVSATVPGVLEVANNLFDMIELCDPRQPGVIMTRGTPDLDYYTVEGGKITGVSHAKI